MWIPGSADEIEHLAKAGSLEETHTFDAKLLPSANKDIAIDVCAMTVDGGTLLYGIGEDADRRPTVPAPLELAGLKERIDQVVGTSIAERPTIEIVERPLDHAPDRGYLVVAVPPSPRAPHQVIVRNTLRYYGRGATGNRPLTEQEIAALYARRERWDVDRDALLDRAINEAPVDLAERNAGFLHAVAQMTIPDDEFLRKLIGVDPMPVRNALRTGANRVEATFGAPALRELTPWRLSGDAGLEIGDLSNPRRAIYMKIDHDGRATFVSCAAARQPRADPQDPLTIFEGVIAGNVASFLGAIGALYEKSGYLGPVDVAIAITGIQGATIQVQGLNQRPYPGREYREHARVLAGKVASEPTEVARDLLRRFGDGMLGPGLDLYVLTRV